MPRPPRIDFPDAIYHVTSRGNGRDVIFWSDDDRTRFLGQLADNLQTAAVVLYAFVLMDNHIHLLVRTPRANLSRFMQRLLTAYSLYARFKHRRPGHQLQGRFKAKLVQDDVYLRAVTRYMHLNPVKIAACRKLDRSNSRDTVPNSLNWDVMFLTTTTTCIISSATSRAPGSAATTATIPAVARARGMAGRRGTTRALQTWSKPPPACMIMEAWVTAT